MALGWDLPKQNAPFADTIDCVTITARNSYPDWARSRNGRWIALGEVALATLVVLGHNVWSVLPNEVPILFVLYWVSTRLHRGRWSAPGFPRPKSWRNTVLLAVVAAALLQLGSEFVVQPLATHLSHQTEAVSTVFKAPAFDLRWALRSLVIVWVFAALGEETGYRGYLLERTVETGGGGRFASLAAVGYTALLFGMGHFYKGPAGIMDSTYSGLVLGGVYLLAGRNLWAAILAHGLCDTFAVVVVFLGWAT